MASSIDSTKPVTGSPTTQSVRDNFSFTKTEINELQRITEDAVTAAGTVNALVADFTNDVTLAEGVTICVKASGANTSTTPTLNVDGTGAKTIVKENGTALIAGDIEGSRHYLLLRYDATNTVWVLLNPAISTNSAARANHTGTQAQSTVTNLVSDLAAKVTATDSLDKGYITGLVPSNAVDADHDITISVGECRDSADGDDIRLTSAITKQIDAAWVAGNNAGGLFSGTVAADTTYHVFVIKKDSDGSIDAGFDTSVTAANIPAGYTAFRRVASLKTNALSNFVSFSAADARGAIRLSLGDRVEDVVTTSPGTTAVTVGLSVPADIQVLAHIVSNLVNASTTQVGIFETTETDVAPDQVTRDLRVAASGDTQTVALDRMTNTSGQIRYRSSAATVSFFNIITHGWTDFRE